MPCNVGAIPVSKNSSASRLPSIVKPQRGNADTKAAMPTLKHGKKSASNGSVVDSLDSVQRVKLRDMLKQEEETLRKMIEMEHQQAWKAEQ